MGVTIMRKGYSGPITVTVADPPAGLTVRPGTIAAGQTAGALTLTASPDATFPAAPLKLVGPAQGAERPDRTAGDASQWSSPAERTSRCASIDQFGLVAAPALALRR